MYTTYHEVRDQAKLAELICSMERHGWQGAPLVADGDQLLTGSHRYPAALAAGITPEVVDIRDICPEWDAIHADEGSPIIGEIEYVWALERIPAAVREAYGIDIH